MKRRYGKYRESGFEWIGEIPEGWEVLPLKIVADNPTKKVKSNVETIRISPENVVPNSGICLNYYSEYDGEGTEFQSGDILLNKLRIYLKKILITTYDGLSMGEMIVLRVKDAIKSRFLYYLLFHDGFINYLNCQSEGVKLPRVSPETILNSIIPLPPLPVQEKIVKYLDHKTTLIDNLISITERKIELLKEKRTALINHAVTKGLDPNVRMKDSGIEWIGEIPGHWEVKK